MSTDDELMQLGEPATTWAPADISRDRWSVLRPVAIDILMRTPRCAPGTNLQRIRRLTNLLHWAHYTRGLPLKIEIILTPDTVDQWAHNLPTASTARHYRSTVTVIARHATRTAPWPPITEFSNGETSRPYTPAEISDLRHIADAQSTDFRRHLAHSIITFGLAAGIDGRAHYRTLVAGDIIDTDDRISIRFTPQRRVAIHPRWNSQIRDAVAGLEPDQPLLHRRSLTTNLYQINKSHSGHRTTLHLGRLRSTYIVELLERQLPLTVVLHATGLTTSTRLHELLRYTTPLSAHDLDRALRRTGLS